MMTKCFLVYKSHTKKDDKGEGGVKNWPKTDDIICEWPLRLLFGKLGLKIVCLR